MIHSKPLNKGTLTLLDTNEERLKILVNLTQMVIDAKSSRFEE
ncbi:hypothetical protein [Metabacillus niabensis]